MAEKPLFTSESLRELIDGGENQYVEFKGTWSYERETPEPLGRDAVRRTIAAAVAAFANADGGTLVLGVDDDGVATGLGRDGEEIEQLIKAPANRLRSPVSYDHQLLTLDGKEVLAFAVASSPRAVMVEGDGFPYRNGDQTIQEEQSFIDALKETLRTQDFERRIADATEDDVDFTMLPSKASDPAWANHYGLILARRGSPAITNATVMLAGKGSPVRWHPTQTIRIFRVDGKEKLTGANYNVIEIERIDLPIIKSIPRALDLLNGQIRRSARLHDLFFREFPEYPEFAWQEAVINAVAHRNYSDRGRGVEVWVYDDRLEVHSPGGLVAPVTLDSLSEGRGVHVSRNPIIARVLTELDLMREAGEGVRRMIEEMEGSFLHPPEFSVEYDTFKVTLRNTPIFVGGDPVWQHLVERLTSDEAQRRVLLAHPEGFTNEEFRQLNGGNRDTAYAQIKSMVASGIVLPPERPGPKSVYRLSPDLLESKAWLSQRLPGVTGHLATQGRISNADYRALFEVSRQIAKTELSRLAGEGVLRLVGSGRGAHYVLDSPNGMDAE